MVEIGKSITDEILISFDVAQGARMVWSALHAVGSTSNILSHPADANQLTISIVRFLQAEVYKLLCTNDKDYTRERNLLKKTSLPAISLLAGFVAGKFGIPTASAASVAAALFLIPLKLGVGAWCASLSKKTDLLAQQEAQIIAHLAGKE